MIHLNLAQTPILSIEESVVHTSKQQDRPSHLSVARDLRPWVYFNFLSMNSPASIGML